jgi:hypothetical protein
MLFVRRGNERGAEVLRQIFSPPRPAARHAVRILVAFQEVPLGTCDARVEFARASDRLGDGLAAHSARNHRGNDDASRE